MNTACRLAAAFTAGAALMYFLDPSTGRRRRALTRDRGLASVHDAGHFARAKSKQALDHAQGLIARTKSSLSSAPVDDGQLHGRIRSKLGRLIDHPGRISIEVSDGNVTLSGSATPEEIGDLTDALSRVHGVQHVENRLSSTRPAHESFVHSTGTFT